MFMKDAKLLQSFSRNPKWRRAVCRTQDRRSSLVHQFIKQLLPTVSFSFGDSNQAKLHQGVMQLVGILSLRPGLFAHSLDRGHIQATQIRGRFGIQKAAVDYSEDAAVFRGCVVEEG